MRRYSEGRGSGDTTSYAEALAISVRGLPLEQECHYQIADTDADECGYPAGELEGVVDDILAYVGVSSPGYFDPLYGNLTGIALMTGLLTIYLVACFMGDKILSGLEEAG